MYIAIYHYGAGAVRIGSDIITYLDNKADLEDYLKQKLDNGVRIDRIDLYEAKKMSLKSYEKTVPKPIYKIEI